MQTLTAPAAGAEGLEATSATLTYFGVNVARRVGLTPADVRSRFDDSPFVNAFMSTPFGGAAIITLPLTYIEMVRDPAGAVRYAQAGLDLAQQLGARHVSLAGLLASAMDYGNRLDAPPGVLTTGHATTVASVLKTTAAVLATAGRSWADETVTVLGMGSIGQATAEAALAVLGKPGRLLLGDLAAKEPSVRELGARLEALHPGLDWSFVNPTGAEGELYESTLVIGCTSTPNVLQVDRLRPGCVVVDDSVPHCFDVDRAYARSAEAGDLILANGGLLHLPQRFPVRSYAPPLLHEGLGWPAGLDQGETLTSCFLSPLLMALEPALPATVGLGVPTSAVLANIEVLDRLGITAPPIRCGGRSPSAGYLAAFADRFGGRSRS
ncbi:hypothetical protein Acy02nite_89040 [Actinoplanes cyaneus]|uniref:Uncharacterized protein n=1 Tax=Actinoplanes cyaneus TaxID=52696 RepID=A0A919IWF2_9ACTN|nr:hypothetical protein Acy02nite_89040 [Actinoplanes cyaneus]